MACSSRVRRLHRIIACGDEPELWHLPDFGYGYDVSLRLPGVLRDACPTDRYRPSY